MAAVRVPPSAWMHVAIDGDLALAELRQVDHGAQRAADQALDLLRAARGMADGRLAPRALVGGARQHAVFGRHPAAPLALEPRRHALFQARRAEDMRVAELDEARALGMHRHRALDRDAAKLVGLAFGGTHGGALLFRCSGCAGTLGEQGPGFNRKRQRPFDGRSGITLNSAGKRI